MKKLNLKIKNNLSILYHISYLGNIYVIVRRFTQRDEPRIWNRSTQDQKKSGEPSHIFCSGEIFEKGPGNMKVVVD